MRFHAKAREFGEQDEIALVLVRALITRGENFEAERLLAEYLLQRREKFEIPPPLRQLAIQLHCRG